MSYQKIINPLICNNSVTINDNLSITGTVDGRDISVDGETLDNHIGDVNKHIDHSTTSLIAGNGLTGGGDLTISRTLNVVGVDGIVANSNNISLGINNLSTLSIPDYATDVCVIWDSSISQHKKITLSNLLNNGISRTYVSTTPYTALVSDHIIAVNITSESIIINLPIISSFNGIVKKYIIVDEGGSSSKTKYIKITPNVADTINGDSDLKIKREYQSVSIYSNTSNKWVVY